MDHVFQLNSHQLKVLHSCLRLEGEVAERAKMICELHDCGRVAEVAESCHSDPRVVRKWFNRFCTEGISGLKDRKRSGRPKRVNEKKLSALLTHIDQTKGRLTLRHLLRNPKRSLQQRHNIIVS